MQLLNYAGELGCASAGGRRERLACISKVLQGPLAALARTADPTLTANPALLRARLEGARTRGGCSDGIGAAPSTRGIGRLALAFARDASQDAFRADGVATPTGGSFTLLPGAAGAKAGTLRMAGSPLQMLRGGSNIAGSNHQPQVRAILRAC